MIDREIYLKFKTWHDKAIDDSKKECFEAGYNLAMEEMKDRLSIAEKLLLLSADGESPMYPREWRMESIKDYFKKWGKNEQY